VTISRSKKSRSANVALTSLVNTTIAHLDVATGKLTSSSPALSADEKARTAKLRKGGERIIPQLATLIQKAGLDGVSIPVDDMLSNLEQGQTLMPLQQRLGEASKAVEDQIFRVHTASWQTAMHGYAALQRLSVNDGALAASLQPITDFFAYRHVGDTTQTPATKPARKVAAKLTKAQKQIAAQAKRAQAALDRATAILGGATADTSATASDPGVADPSAATTAPAAASLATTAVTASTASAVPTK